MIIECIAPPKRVITLKDVNFVKGKPTPVTMVRGDKMELMETDIVVQSRYHGDIYLMERNGSIKVTTEPQRPLFSPVS